MVVTRHAQWFITVCSVLALVCYVLWSTGTPVMAKDEIVEIDWESLDLSTQQREQLHQLDRQWKSSVSQVAPRLQSNRKKLKTLMASPGGREEDILQLQQQIHQDNARLRMDATQIYLNKRRILNREQEEKLRYILNSH